MGRVSFTHWGKGYTQNLLNNGEMSFKVTKEASEAERHSDDVECCIVMNGLLYTGSDDGFIKAWNTELELQASWQAHEYVVYDLACNPEKNILYSCSMDGEIKMWAVDSVPVCINPACKQVPRAEEQQALSMSQSPSGSCCSRGASCMLGM